MKAYLVETEKKTIRDMDGRVLFFGAEEFLERIVKGKCCFICGSSPKDKEFNDEHIIPDWILRKFKLHSEQIRLANQTHFRYGAYTVPCCKECNTRLGIEVETPVSELLKKPYDEIVKDMSECMELHRLLFRWLCLIYFKSHLKDTMLLMDRDIRNKAGYIGDYYDWYQFHHIHAIARAHYTGAVVDPQVYGTLLVLPAVPFPGSDGFDYSDNLAGQTIMIQLGNVVVAAVLNDSNIGLGAYGHRLDKITGPLNPFQLKELYARMVFVNTHLKEKPQYYSTVTSKGYEILATVPEEFEILPAGDGEATVGELIHNLVEGMTPDDLPNRKEILNDVKEGRRVYIFDQDGNFIKNELSKTVGNALP